MRRNFTFTTALAVCCTLAFGSLMAAERSGDRSADRTKRSMTGQASGTATDLRFSNAHKTDQTRVASAASVRKAENILVAAGRDKDTAHAIAELNRILGMNLDASSEEGQKILAETYRQLGDRYGLVSLGRSTHKQVHYYSQGLQYATQPQMRQMLETKLAAAGGALSSVVMRPSGNSNSTLVEDGTDDTCLGAGAITIPWSEVTDIDFPGDADWRAFTISGSLGATLRIQTISDTPGTFDDDTTLTLFGGCDAGGNGVNQIAFNDDDGATGAPFTSRIDTPCLGPGTYYVRIGGFADVVTSFNFTFEVTQTGSCVVPLPDAFEPDDARADANPIGHATSNPPNSNGWGRAQKEIQAHSIFPPGDADTMSVKLGGNELVRTATAITFPTFFNDFTSVPAGLDIDTVIEVVYTTEKAYGGRCNEQNTAGTPGPGPNPPGAFNVPCMVDNGPIFVGDPSVDNASLGCDFNNDGQATCSDLVNPFPAGCCADNDLDDCFPACIPIYFFNAPFGVENPLAFNDDEGGGSFGSNLLTCLPRTQPVQGISSSGGEDWLVRTCAFSANVFDFGTKCTAPVPGPGQFDYEVLVKNEVRCNFESEPNNAFDTANDLTLGETISGIFDYALAFPFQDDDYYRWDVTEDSIVTFDTNGYDVFNCDTGLDIFVGPDDTGTFFFTGLEDDDGGPGWLSHIQAIFPPANDLLGNTVADADYYIDVTSFYLNPNFPYDLITASAAVPPQESEPNNTCATANDVDLGDTVLASISPSCDYDSYHLTLASNTFLTVRTTGGDTTIKVEGAGTIANDCDDDSGGSFTSLLQGCLPPGDYCVRVRSYLGLPVSAYQIAMTGTTGCSPTVPPSLGGDGGFACATGYDTCP